MNDRTILWGSGASQRQVQRAVERYFQQHPPSGGTDTYALVQVIAGPETPVISFLTVRPQGARTFTNLDEGTVLWARCAQSVVIEVAVG